MYENKKKMSRFSISSRKKRIMGQELEFVLFISYFVLQLTMCPIVLVKICQLQGIFLDHS